MDTYIAPDELRAIADYCTALYPLWDALTTGPKGGVTFETSDGAHIEFDLFDSRDDKLGTISWGEDGPAFYPNKESK